MKVVFFILLSILLFSCNQNTKPPSETEVIGVVKDLFNPKDFFTYQKNTEFDKIDVVKIDRGNSNGLFSSIVIVKGRMYGFIYEPDFIDTLHLVLKKENLKWIVKEKNHHFKPRKESVYSDF